MSNIAPFISKSILTMSSREIADMVESRHDSVKRTIERCAESGSIPKPPLVDGIKGANGVVEKIYHLDKRSSLIVVAQLSPGFTAKIVDRWQELEQRESQCTVAGQSNVFALAMVESMARTLRMSESGVLLMYQKMAGIYAPEAVSAIPVYAIDAPPSTTGAAPTSSMPTASLTTLLDEFDIGVSAVTANKMLANAGLLEAIERPSSRGAVKRFWSVTDAGLKYGKNVVSPSNPKETQPHWYKALFKELVNTYMVA